MPLPVFCGIHNSLDWKWARAFGRQSDIACFSWSILMSLNVTFSNVWGILLKEWKGCGSRTIGVLLLGLVILVTSIIVVAMAQA